MFFLVNIIIINFIYSIIVLPLRKTQLKINIANSNEFINYFLSNNLYTIIKIGEPSQNLEVSIKEEPTVFSINSFYCNLNKFYNRNISKTFINLTKFEENIFNFYDCCIAQESFYFYTDLDLKKEKKFENIKFIYEKEKKVGNEIYNSNCAKISLGFINYYNEKNDYDFITELKKLDLINEYTWTVKFVENDKNNDIEGYLIIGDYPHTYDNINYNEINLRATVNNMEENNWNLEFMKITVNDTQLTHYMIGVISFDKNYIIGTEEYKAVINSMFFNKYIYDGICFEDNINSHYFLFYCKSNLFNKEDIDQFPSLNFFHFQYNFTFSLNGSDLFFENNGYFYFLVIFDRYNYRNWNLGKLFLKKYQLIFNPDSKMISYYLENNEVNNKDDNGQIKNKDIIIIILIIIVLISFIVGMTIGKFLYDNKKKKGKEMKEEYLYKKSESFEDSDKIEQNKIIDSINT